MQQGLFRFFSIAIMALLLTGCPTAHYVKVEVWKKEIKAADKAFSDLSKKEGMKIAFIEYMENDGVLLRPNHPPIVGADAIDFLSQSADTAYTLTWSPSAADVSQSGDLGYSYGTYTLQMRDTALYGTYVSIWKKQDDGKWKFVLDSGNPGLNTKPMDTLITQE